MEWVYNTLFESIKHIEELFDNQQFALAQYPTYIYVIIMH